MISFVRARWLAACYRVRMRTKQVPVYVDGEIVCYDTVPANATVFYLGGSPWYALESASGTGCTPLAPLGGVDSAVGSGTNSRRPSLGFQGIEKLCRKGIDLMVRVQRFVGVDPSKP